jgi:hypothetical protein
MAIRFLVGDVSGTLIAELECDIGPVSWRLNDVGSVKFGVARTSSKATSDFLKYGNRVLIEFDNGLPNWTGIIDPPREWNKGMIQCTAYSAEYILGFRQTDKGRYFSDASVGYIFEHLISESNLVEDTGIAVGSVYYGGDNHWPDYHFDNLLKTIRESLCDRLSDYDFEVVGSESGGRISLTANLYERKGSSKANVVLIEGSNLTEQKLLEQGSIINYWDVAGEGNEWGSTRLVSNAQDVTSRSTYGLRQGAAIFSSVSVQTTLDNHATTLLDETKDVHSMVDLSVVNESPALFQDYDVGDSVRVILTTCGFGGFDDMVRIWAREYDPRTGACRLVTREDE